MDDVNAMIEAEQEDVAYRDVSQKLAIDLLERLDAFNKDLKELHKRRYVNVTRRIAGDGTFEVFISQSVR